MSLDETIRQAILANIDAKTPTSHITAALVNNLARVIVAGSSKDREVRESMVEIVRNELDQAVMHYVHILPTD